MRTLNATALNTFNSPLGSRKKKGLQGTFEKQQLAEMEVFVFFICKMTLLVRTVGGSKLAPYDSNCSKSVCVCVCVPACVLVCAECSGVCVSGKSDGATGPTAGSCGEVDEVRFAEGKCQRGDITVHITPTQPGEAITWCISDIIMQIK